MLWFCVLILEKYCLVKKKICFQHAVTVQGTGSVVIFLKTEINIRQKCETITIFDFPSINILCENYSCSTRQMK